MPEVNDVYDQPGEPVEQAPPTLSELVAIWEDAKADVEREKRLFAQAKADYTAASLAERAAYKAMNEAISATKPKRAKKKTATPAAAAAA